MSKLRNSILGALGGSVAAPLGFDIARGIRSSMRDVKYEDMADTLYAPGLQAYADLAAKLKSVTGISEAPLVGASALGFGGAGALLANAIAKKMDAAKAVNTLAKPSIATMAEPIVVSPSAVSMLDKLTATTKSLPKDYYKLLAAGLGGAGLGYAAGSRGSNSLPAVENLDSIKVAYYKLS